MTGREKIEAALSPDGSREIPVVICYEGIFIRDHWDQLTGSPWWHQFSPDIEQVLSWRRDVIRAVGLDWTEVGRCLPREARARMRAEPRGDSVVIIDPAAGSEISIPRPVVGGWSSGGGIESVHPATMPESIEEMQALLPAPPAGEPSGMSARGEADLARRMVGDVAREVFPIASVGSPLWQLYGILGFEGMMSLVATRPRLARTACQRFLERGLHQVHEARELGARGIWIEECLTDQVSPRDYAALSLPCVRALVEEIRRSGLWSLYYYCGNPWDRWPLILESGADAISLEESKKGFSIDIEDVVEKTAGRAAVLGNLDAIGVLQEASDAGVEAEVRRQLAAGRKNGSRFIMSTGSPVTPRTPVARVRRYVELSRRIGAS